MSHGALSIISPFPSLDRSHFWQAIARDLSWESRVYYGALESEWWRQQNGTAADGNVVDCDARLLEGYDCETLPTIKDVGSSWRFRYLTPRFSEVTQSPLSKQVYLIHGKEFMLYWQAMFQRVQNPAKRLIFMGDTPLDEQGGAVENMVRRFFYHRADAILCVGCSQFDYYGRYGIPREKLFWSPYALNYSFFEPKSKMDLRSELGISPETYLFLFVGRFEAIKRPLELIQAFEACGGSVNGRPVALAMVGEGSLLHSCRRYCRERQLKDVHFLGFREPEVLGDTYHAADCLVMPSKRESWGRVLLEALPAALWLLASDGVSGADDLVRPGCNGLRFSADSIRALKDAMEYSVINGQKSNTEHHSRGLMAEYSLENKVRGLNMALDWVGASY